MTIYHSRITCFPAYRSSWKQKSAGSRAACAVYNHQDGVNSPIRRTAWLYIRPYLILAV